MWCVIFKNSSRASTTLICESTRKFFARPCSNWWQIFLKNCLQGANLLVIRGKSCFLDYLRLQNVSISRVKKPIYVSNTKVLLAWVHIYILISFWIFFSAKLSHPFCTDRIHVKGGSSFLSDFPVAKSKDTPQSSGFQLFRKCRNECFTFQLWNVWLLLQNVTLF